MSKQVNDGAAGDSVQNAAGQRRGVDDSVYFEEHVHASYFFNIFAVYAVQP
ncbi:hypothetical protein D3C78_1623640 [compost metagenome]